MHYIYISPHLDDAVFSCGGLIWEQNRGGDRVEIWTISAGYPPPGPFSPLAEMLHARWGTGPEAITARREEDQRACRIVGAVPRYLDIPDVIYRRLPDGEPVAQTEVDLQNPLHPAEVILAEQRAALIAHDLPPDATLVSPLGLGGHVDHRLTRVISGWLAAHGWDQRLYYYADYPYVVRHPEDLGPLRQEGFEPLPVNISPAGLHAWQAAVAAHASQISTFWESVAALEAQLEQYWQAGGGGLWQKGEGRE